MLMFQGEAGTGNVVEAVRHCRAVMGAVKALQAMDDDELYVFAKDIRAPIELVRQVRGSQSASPANSSETASVPYPCLLRACIIGTWHAWFAKHSMTVHEAPGKGMIPVKQTLPAADHRDTLHARTCT